MKFVLALACVLSVSSEPDCAASLDKGSAHGDPEDHVSALQKMKSLQLDLERSDSQRSSITAVSYNTIWHLVVKDNLWDALHGTIGSHAGSTDLFGFQECDDVASFAPTLPGFTFWQAKAAAAMAWRSSRFSQVGSGGSEWVGDDGMWGPRYLNWVRLRESSGQMVFFGNTHGPVGCVGNPNDFWVNAINTKRHSGDKVVLTGDFNCGIGAMSGLRNMFTTHVDAGIDHIFSDFSHGFTSHKGPGVTYPSDHPLVKVTLSGLGGGSPTPTRRRSGGGGCTPDNQDPWQTGVEVACCSGNKQVNNWDGDGRWYWKCIGGSGGSPSPPSGGAWKACGPGSTACCNPYTSPTQICPGGGAEQCQECGGGSACECPGSGWTVSSPDGVGCDLKKDEKPEWCDKKARKHKLQCTRKRHLKNCQKMCCQ